MKTKRELKYFTIAQYEQEQEYLRKKHQEGWKFVRVNLLGCYLFEKCEPEDVIYQLFKDCGWEYIQSLWGFQYFRRSAKSIEKADKSSSEIFCDDESRLDMVKRIMHGRMFILAIFFIGNIIPQLLINQSMANEQGYRKVLAVVYYLLFLLYMAIFLNFGLKYLKFENKIKKEEKAYHLKTFSITVVAVILTALATVGLVMTTFRTRENDYYEKYSNTEYKVSAKYFDGKLTKTLEIKQGDEVEVDMYITNGNIEVDIFDEDGVKVYHSTFGARSRWVEKAFRAEKDGKYTVKISAKNAEGNWNVAVN